VLELTDDDVDEMMRVNVKSALYGMQVAAAHMRPRRAGQIVNVSSLLGRVPELPVRSAYSAAKHALNSLTADLRVELKDAGVTVTLVSPGITFTGFGLNALHGGVDSRSLPGGQTAEEVAAVIADAIETKALDVYTRREFQDRVVGYFSAMAGLENRGT
jgi:NAD(P)-dependent dehydrogenase (short-subunit alcohol dehydrogenase family)